MRLELPSDRALRVVIVSDTHSAPHPDSFRWVAKEQPDVILHAGDIGDLAVLDRLAELAPVTEERSEVTVGRHLPRAASTSLSAGVGMPSRSGATHVTEERSEEPAGRRAATNLIAVRGNIDTRAADIPDSVDLAITDGDVVRLRILLIHIAVYGPKLRAEVARLAAAHSAQLVVCGHSHVPFIGRDRGVTLFNPGSIGPRRPPLPITFGVLEVTATSASLRHMSCETGERWRP